MAVQHLSNINLINWNANGVTNKKHELNYFLKAKQIKIACITESHLKSNIVFNMPGYNILRTDRLNSNGGGVMILIERTVPYIQVNLPNTPGLETAAIKFPLNNRLLTLIAAYKSPQVKIQDTNIESLFQLNSPSYSLEI